jgi:hypothetical protein
MRRLKKARRSTHSDSVEKVSRNSIKNVTRQGAENENNMVRTMPVKHLVRRKQLLSLWLAQTIRQLHQFQPRRVQSNQASNPPPEPCSMRKLSFIVERLALQTKMLWTVLSRQPWQSTRVSTNLDSFALEYRLITRVPMLVHSMLPWKSTTFLVSHLPY